MGGKFLKFALFPLMLLMLLFVSTRMVAQTTTEDPRYALFKNLEGITDVTITDDGSYPWKMLDLNADGMKDLGFTIPDGSKGLMSSNYNVDGSSSETVVNFTVEKPMLLTFKYLVSSEYNFDKATITLDNKEPWTISEKKQIEIKALLSVGEHSLKLSYTKDVSGNENADRTCIYDLKTATTFSEYVADYVATNSTLTFKKITSDNLEGLDLSRLAMVDNIDGVQDVCTNYSSIKNIVFDESFKTYAPTSLREFFKGCETLETISDLEYLNTAKVTDMGKMFHGCSALTSLNLTNFNTENVTDMSWMFYGCSALKSLDLTNFNTAKVTYMNNMFEGCSALTTIYVSNKFVTDNVSNGSDMFTGCKSLKDYSDSKTDHTYANCGTDGYFTPVFDYAEFNNATGTLTFRRGLSKPEGAYDLNMESNNPGWEAQKRNIKKVVFDASFANARPTSCCWWFGNCFYLTEIEGIENLNTQNVTDMRDMFTCCYALTSLDVSIFNTQNVKNMNGMFCDCSNLTSLDLTNFNTAKVTNMGNMFLGCSNLTSLDLTNFNTAKVTNMGNMFLGCSNLTSLDLTNFNTAKVTDMHFMFKGCSALTSLDLTNFNTAEVRDMNRMFYMLDKSSTALTTIYVSDNFVTTNVQNGEKMFKNCTKLKGFQKYSLLDTDHRYANYKTGYFTKLVGKNGEEKIGATGKTLATENLVLDDGKDFVAYEPFAAKEASYNRDIPEGSTWGTLCLPFAIDQSKETGCKFYRLTGIDKDCITLESYEDGAEIPAGTPVLFKMNEGVKKLEISAQDADLVKEPVAGTNTDVNLVGSFTKIGGNGNQGLDKNDYIIGKNKFWRVFDLNDGNGVGIKPMRAYIHPATASQARAAMLSIGKGDGTTAIDNLNAISNDANAEYYDANGRRTNGLQKGLNIVKRGSKTYKIMVK